MKRRFVRRLSLEQLERREVLSVTFMDSGQTFGEGIIRTVEFGDLDGDQDVDAFVVRYNESGEICEIWLNNGQGVFSRSDHAIAPWAVGVALGDVDGDGDVDALISNDKAFERDGLWLNDGDAHFSNSGQVFDVEGVCGLRTLEDLDGDGDLDAILSRQIWANDGEGNFFRRQSIPGWAGAWGDMDGDGDIDAVQNSKVYLNDGNARFSRTLENTEIRVGGYPLVLGDVDGDGDLDMMSPISGWFPPVTVWSHLWLNDGGGHLTAGQNVWNSGEQQFELADIDLDGDLDVLTVAWDGEDTDRYELRLNDGRGNYGEVVFSISLRDGNRPRDMTCPSQYAPRPAFADVDGDGDSDTFFAGRLWLTNGNAMFRPRLEGDANHDGEFNQTDIVQVLQTAKYRTGEPATWDEGDWNEDGAFDELDLITALQTGMYVQGPYAVVDAAINDQGN